MEEVKDAVRENEVKEQSSDVNVEKAIPALEELSESNSFENASLESLAQYAEQAGFDIEEEDETVLVEDLDGFAKGFPSWDLLPPKK